MKCVTFGLQELFCIFFFLECPLFMAILTKKYFSLSRKVHLVLKVKIQYLIEIFVISS